MCTLIKINGIYNSLERAENYNVFTKILININDCEITVNKCEHLHNNIYFNENLYNFNGDSFLLNNINVYLNYLELAKEDKDISDFININEIAKIIFNYILLYFIHDEYNYDIINFDEA